MCLLSYEVTVCAHQEEKVVWLLYVLELLYCIVHCTAVSSVSERNRLNPHGRLRQVLAAV